VCLNKKLYRVTRKLEIIEKHYIPFCIKKHPVGCRSERSEETLESADSNRFCQRNVFNDNNLCLFIV